MQVAEVILWASAALLAYSYLFYPAILRVVSFLVADRRNHSPAEPGDAGRLSVDVIVAAHNEERHIATRVRNILGQDYPPDRLRVIVGSDGSTDGTAERVRELGEPRAMLLAFGQNRGKASVLNDLVAASTADVLVFTDANTSFSADAVRKLARHFSDDSVACVCGELELTAAAGTNQDSLYWRVEQFLKSHEGRIGGLLGANGGIYAIRREHYRPLPPDTIVDDFCVAMTAGCVSGARLVYDPEARATEDTPPSIADEYRRRVRIGIGNYQVLFRHPEYLYRLGPATTFTYVSHKVLRWLGPHLLLLALAANAFLLAEPAYCALFTAQLACHGMAVVAIMRPDVRWRPAPLRALLFILALNIAFLVGFMKYVRGDFAGSWQRSRRT